MQYPALHFEAIAVKGANNQLPNPIYLPQLLMSEAKVVGGSEDVVLRMPGIEGYEMKIFANSVTFPDGSKQGPVVVSPIAGDKLPMTPPGGYAGFMAPAATIQPSGTRFDPPAQLKLPNTAGFAPGEKKPVYQWDHDLATFEQMGQATVTDDGLFLITDAGTGISKAGWHPIPNPPPPEDCPKGGNAPICPQCNDLATTGGKCPKQYCKPTDGGSCDDGKYCTKEDKCVGGTCKGTPEPDVEGSENVAEFNLKTFNQVYRVMQKLGLGPRDLEFKASLAMQERQMCCESKQGEKTKGGRAKLEGKFGLGAGPFTVAGFPPIPVPSLASGRIATMQVGAFVSFEVNAGANAQAKFSQCEGYEACWGGGGAVGFEATGEIGGIVKDGPIVAAKATGGLNTGIQAAMELTCDSAKIPGVYWSGVQVRFVIEFNDGQFHWERNFEWYGPEMLPGVDVPWPALPK